MVEEQNLVADLGDNWVLEARAIDFDLLEVVVDTVVEEDTIEVDSFVVERSYLADID